MPRASRKRSCALSISRPTHIHTHTRPSYLCAFGDALLDASTLASTVSYAILVKGFTRLGKIAHAHIIVFAFCRVLSVFACQVCRVFFPLGELFIYKSGFVEQERTAVDKKGSNAIYSPPFFRRTYIKRNAKINKQITVHARVSNSYGHLSHAMCCYLAELILNTLVRCKLHPYQLAF